MITCPDCGAPWPVENREACPGCGLPADDLEAAADYLRDEESHG